MLSMAAEPVAVRGHWEHQAEREEKDIFGITHFSLLLRGQSQVDRYSRFKVNRPGE